MNQNLAQRDEALRRKDDKLREVSTTFNPLSSSLSNHQQLTIVFSLYHSYNFKFLYCNNN